MKKIIILGAGTYQVPLIKKAKEIGLYTIVISIKGNYPGFSLADKVYFENTTDCDKILQISKAENVDGIVTAGTDVAVVTIGKVCDALGLCGLSHRAGEIASNKMLMKTEFEKAGVRTARFKKVYFTDNIPEKVIGLNYPLIFKAVDTSGSRGIVRVNSQDGFKKAVLTVKNITKQDFFIIEEFITGEEFGAQAYIKNGEIQFILPHGDIVFQGDTGVPIGHYAPFEISKDILKDTEIQLKNAINAMGLNNCAVNADFILSDNKVYVLEIGGRSGATCLAELVSIYYGYNYYEKLLLACLGEDVDFKSNLKISNASRLLTSEKDGIIVSQKNENTYDENIYEIHFDHKVGDRVSQFRVGSDRIGHIITKGESLEDAFNTLNRAADAIKIEVK